MSLIKVDVALYGDIARAGGGRHVAQLIVKLKPGSTKNDLLQQLGIGEEERSYLFINGVLHDVPGLSVEEQEPLHEGDHVGIFSRTHMWPYQYRDGVRMSEALKVALKEHGALHHSYRFIAGDER